MWSSIRRLVPVLSLLYAASFGQGHAQRAKAQRQVVSIPFQITAYNNLSVKAVLNGKDTVDLMVHTAANAVTITEETSRRLNSVRFDGQVNDVKSWGGADNSSRFSRHNSLQIGTLTWSDVTVWEDTNSGQETAGKFGLNLFDNQVVEFDFDQSRLIIHPKLPRYIKKYQKLNLTVRQDNLFLEAACRVGERTVKNQFLLHSGYAGSVLFDDKFVSDNNLGNAVTITGTKELSDAYGNKVITKKAILSELEIGGYTLHHVPVGFFEGAIGRQKMSLIGGDILKRFNLIIDANRTHIYLKANHLQGSGYLTS